MPIYFLLKSFNINFCHFDCYTLRFPFKLDTPLGFAACSPVVMGAFVLIFYSVICALGILIGCFALMVSITEHIQLKYYNLVENYKVHRSVLKFMEEFRNIFRFVGITKELSIFVIVKCHILAYIRQRDWIHFFGI